MCQRWIHIQADKNKVGSGPGTREGSYRCAWRTSLAARMARCKRCFIVVLLSSAGGPNSSSFASSASFPTCAASNNSFCTVSYPETTPVALLSLPVAHLTWRRRNHSTRWPDFATHTAGVSFALQVAKSGWDVHFSDVSFTLSRISSKSCCLSMPEHSVCAL